MHARACVALYTLNLRLLKVNVSPSLPQAYQFLLYLQLRRPHTSHLVMQPKHIQNAGQRSTLMYLLDQKINKKNSTKVLQYLKEYEIKHILPQAMQSGKLYS